MMTKNICGTEVSYTLQGSGKGKLLLLHGWGCDGRLMQSVANAFADRFQILIPDFPGHGNSGKPPEPWGVQEYADCIRILLEETGFVPCCVIAHSFGCRIVSVLAATHPQLFVKIIFTGGAGIRKPLSDEAQKRTEHYKKLKGLYESFGKIPLMHSAAEKMEDRLRKKYGSADYNALDEEMRKTFVKVISQDLTEYYPHFQASTLLIWGDQDTETPIWMGHEIEKRISDCALIRFEGGSHFAYLEQIQRFNAIAVQFLKED
jgi:pimeloyl-ACP methyl ester carboxylesterase